MARGTRLVRQRNRSIGRRGRRIAAAAIGFALVAAACSDKKDDESVGGADDTTATEHRRAAPETTTPPTTASESRRHGDDHGADGTDGDRHHRGRPRASRAGHPETLPAPEMDPVSAARLVVAGEAEVGAPWTPANVQCDSYCQMRIRTFIEPLFVPDHEPPGPAASSARASSPTRTPRCGRSRSARASRSPTARRSTPTPSSTTSTARSAASSSRGALKDMAKNPDGTLVTEKLDDYTFTIATGKNGDPDAAGVVAALPVLPHRPRPGFIASPTWLAAVDGDPAWQTQPVGTGPFIVQEYLPGDRMTVTKNPDYWRTDDDGNQLPYLDEIEFRVIVDSQVRQQALESGDVDLIATSDPQRRRPLTRERRTSSRCSRTCSRETNYVMFHLTQPQFQDREVRCALIQAIDKQDFIDTVLRRLRRRRRTARSRPARTATSRTPALPEYDPEAAARGDRGVGGRQRPAGRSTTRRRRPATTKATADYLQQNVGRRRRRRHADHDRAVGADHQRPARLAGVRGLRLAQPRRPVRRHPEPLVARLRLRRLRRRDGRRRAVAELRPPQRPGDQRPARPGPRRSDPEESKALAQEINRQFAERVLDPADLRRRCGASTWSPTVQNIGRDPLPDGGVHARRRRVPRPGLARLGVQWPS